jgi:membrane protein
MSVTSIRLREAWNWGGLTVKQLAVRTYQQIDTHETLDRAAALAFYAMLSLVPFLSLLLAGGIGNQRGISSQLLGLSRDLLPQEAATVIEDQVRKMQAAAPAGLLSFSWAILLWSASSFFVGLMDATNAAYGVRDSRSWWKRRIMAAALTIVEVALLAAALVLIVAWPFVLNYIGLGGVASALATVVQWAVALVALLATFAIAYFFGPDVKQEWEWITPGSVLGVLVLVAASVGLRLYVQYVGSYSETYGALAGVVLTLLWLYTASLALLVGAEVNCVIEHAAPHGRHPGEKVARQDAPAMQPPA